MKFFMNKSIWTKIVIALVFVIVFQFVVSKPSLGVNGIIDFGGKLLTPIASLFVTLADAMVNLVHSQIMGVDNATEYIDITPDSGVWKWVVGLGIAIVAIVGAVIAVILVPETAGGSLAAFGAAVSAAAPWVLGGSVAVGLWAISSDRLLSEFGITQARAATYSQEELPNIIPIPSYTMSPEEIFQGKILLFNVNFFEKTRTIYLEANNGNVLDTTNKTDEELEKWLQENSRRKILFLYG